VLPSTAADCNRSQCLIECAVARLSRWGLGRGLLSSVPVAGALASAHGAAPVALRSQSPFLLCGEGQCGELIQDRRSPVWCVKEVFGQGVECRRGRVRGRHAAGFLAPHAHVMLLGTCLDHSKIVVWLALRSVSVPQREAAPKRSKGRRESQFSSKYQQIAARCGVRRRGAYVLSAVRGLVFVVDSAQDGQEMRRAACNSGPGNCSGEYRTVLNQMGNLSSTPILPDFPMKSKRVQRVR